MVDNKRLRELAGIREEGNEPNVDGDSAKILDIIDDLTAMATLYKSYAGDDTDNNTYNIIAKKLASVVDELRDIDTYIDPYH